MVENTAHHCGLTKSYSIKCLVTFILRGRLYVSLPTCDRTLTAMETGALQTLHRAVAGFDTIPPPLVVQFAAPDSNPLAIEALARFADHAAPAVVAERP